LYRIALGIAAGVVALQGYRQYGLLHNSQVQTPAMIFMQCVHAKHLEFSAEDAFSTYSELTILLLLLIRLPTTLSSVLTMHSHHTASLVSLLLLLLASFSPGCQLP
jgi:uncharacterized membrane protein